MGLRTICSLADDGLSTQIDTIATVATERGQVPVIVRLKDPAHTRRWLGRGRTLAETLRERRAELADVQVAVFQYHPYLAMVGDVSTLERLSLSPQVVGVYEDVAHAPSLDVSVPLIGATPAQTGGVDGSGEVVAVLDTGVEVEHAMFFNVNIPADACFSGVSVGGYPGITSLCDACRPARTATARPSPVRNAARVRATAPPAMAPVGTAPTSPALP